MKLATTTSDFGDYCATHADCVKCVCQAGFRYVDFSFYRDNTADSPFMRENWREYALELKKLGDGLGIKYVQAHCPNVNPLDFENGWELAVAVTFRSIEVCKILGIPTAVFHTGWKDGLSKEEYFKENMRFVSRILPALEATGVTLCIENSTRANMGEKYYFFTGEDMLAFFRYVTHPLLKACWDTGHANVEGQQYGDIAVLGSENLKALHINDNRGTGDEHIMPYLGTMCTDEVMHALLDVGYNGYFTFECGWSLPPAKNWFHPRRVFEKDSRLAEPSLSMAMAMEKLVFETGKYILESYNCFEE